MPIDDDKAVWWVVVSGVAGGIGWLFKYFTDKKKQQADTDLTEAETKERKQDYMVKRMQYLEQDNLKLATELEQWREKFKGQIKELSNELENTVFDLQEKLEISYRELEKEKQENTRLKSQLTFYRVKYGENLK
jgi:recombinational DNA repair ATPase RecF